MWYDMNMKYIKLDEIADVFAGVNFSSRQDSSHTVEGIPILNVANITDEGRITGEYKTMNADRDMSRFTVRQGDLVISSRGTVAKAAIVEKEQDGFIISSNLIGVRMKNNKIPAEFLDLYLRSIYGRREVLKVQKSSAMFVHLTVNSVRSINIPIASEEEMVKVKNFLNLSKTITAMITEQMKIISDLQNSLMGEIMEEEAGNDS